MRTPRHRAASSSIVVGLGVAFILTTALPASAFLVHGGDRGGHIAMRSGGFHFRSGVAPGIREHGRFFADHRMFFFDHRGRFANQFFAAFGFPFWGWPGGYPYFGSNGGNFPTADSATSDVEPASVNGGISTGSSPAPTEGWHGDCAVHELIYGDNGSYIGQKVVEACN
jgi:hypothetical protein